MRSNGLLKNEEFLKETSLSEEKAFHLKMLLQMTPNYQ
jgi:hypothetical protein